MSSNKEKKKRHYLGVLELLFDVANDGAAVHAGERGQDQLGPDLGRARDSARNADERADLAGLEVANPIWRRAC